MLMARLAPLRLRWGLSDMSVNDVQHWDLETIHASACATQLDGGDFCLTVQVEVPRDVLGQRLPLHGHRMWPTLVDVGVAVKSFSVLPSTAREMARLLVLAADVADAVDAPDTGACGHWSPCGCKQADDLIGHQ